MTGFLLLAVAAVLLIVGAETFVDNAAGAARRLGITVLAVGLLLAGAEPEELVTAVVASLDGRSGLAAGDALGANLTMLTATLGLAALVRPLPFGRRVRDYAVGSALAGAIAVAAVAGGVVNRLEGLLLLGVYAVLVALVWSREQEAPRIGELAEVDDDEPTTRAPGVALLLALGGIVVMLIGGRLGVSGAERVLASLDVSENGVGLTFLALTTSAELFALVWAAARRGADDIAVAAVVGSAAYNSTVTLGAAALARPLVVHGLTAAAVAAAVAPLLVAGLAWNGRLGRVAGGLLVVLYAGYVVLALR